MVETPGTAPGSATLIPRNVYRHSRKRHFHNWHVRRRISRGCVTKPPTGPTLPVKNAEGRGMAWTALWASSAWG